MSGVNINNYKIEIPNVYKVEGFRNEDIYESHIYNKNNFGEIRKAIKRDGIVITRLIGNNGIINEQEFIKT